MEKPIISSIKKLAYLVASDYIENTNEEFRNGIYSELRHLLKKDGELPELLSEYFLEYELNNLLDKEDDAPYIEENILNLIHASFKDGEINPNTIEEYKNDERTYLDAFKLFITATWAKKGVEYMDKILEEDDANDVDPVIEYKERTNKWAE